MLTLNQKEINPKEIPAVCEIEKEISAAYSEHKKLSAYAQDLESKFYKTIKTKTATRAELKESGLLAEIAKAQKAKNDAGAKIMLLKHNLYISVCVHVLPVIFSELEKFGGKQYGEKTKTKINNTVKEKTGFGFSIASGKMIDLYCYSYGYHTINCYPQSEQQQDVQIITDDNKIDVSSVSGFAVPISGGIDYIFNIQERIEQIETAYAEMVKAQTALEAAKRMYSAFSVDGMPYAYDRHIYEKLIFNV